VFAGKIAITTASRRMGSVIGIYRWLQTEGRLVTAHPTWNEKDVYLSFKDARGFSKSIIVPSDRFAHINQENGQKALNKSIFSLNSMDTAFSVTDCF
jgi:hypothetical protein